jgi:choline dehydrogenase-like flavoprotein
MMEQPRDFGRFDYVIVGAGSAGCVLANRLSARGDRRVLLLEAGGLDNWIWFHVPVGYLFAIGNPRADWMFQTAAETGLNGRSLNYPRGKVIGGSSAINAMIYMRGQAADYDGWRDQGLPGWGWDDVLPSFLQMEDHARPPNGFHRSGGEWRVDFPRMRWQLLDLIRDAADSIGIGGVDDFNTGDNEGHSYFQVNQKRGRRWSAARGFLKPVLKRANLHLATNAHVERIDIDEDNRASGVVFSRGQERFIAHANAEVILAAGAVCSPQILELSGIGQPDHLRDLGIGVVHAAPGVGENLQDHLQLRPIFKVTGVRTLNEDYYRFWRRSLMVLQYAMRRTGALTMAPSQLGIFTRSSAAHARPNLQFHIQPLSLDKFGEAPHRFSAFTASVCNLRPSSRGSVHARSKNPLDKPEIRPNYLSTEEDRRVAVDSIRLARKLAAAAPLARFRPEEFKPGSHLTSDDDLVVAAGDIGTTIFHPVGTAKMGSDGDPYAVLDHRLRVRGVERLRLADASAMPAITSGNTNSPTMMIAQRAAEMIVADDR